MKKRCDILINGLSVGHVYYYYFEFDSLQVNLLDFEFDSLQVNLLDFDKSVICFLLGKPNFLDSELYLSSIDVLN